MNGVVLTHPPGSTVAPRRDACDGRCPVGWNPRLPSGVATRRDV